MVKDRRRRGPWVSGFCASGNHTQCNGYFPGWKKVYEGKGDNRRVVDRLGIFCQCPCGHPKCRTCGRLDTVIDYYQECEDRADCRAHVQKRRAASPTWRLLQEVGQVTDTKTKNEEKTEAKAKPRTPCACGCGELKGDPPTHPKGLFHPGHDAKLKSRLLGVLRDPAQRPEDRQEAKDELKAQRERSGAAGWLRPEDEAIDVTSKEKPAHLIKKSKPKAKSDSDTPPETNEAADETPQPTKVSGKK